MNRVTDLTSRSAIVTLSLLLCGCPGTPPAVPVTKAVSISARSGFDNPKPTYLLQQRWDASMNKWEFTASTSINWDDEPDFFGLVYANVVFQLQTGEQYRFRALNSPPRTNAQGELYIVEEEQLMHSEYIGIYDGSKTSVDVG